MFLENVDAEHKVSNNLFTNQLILFGGRRDSHSDHYELQAGTQKGLVTPAVYYEWRTPNN